MTICWHLLSWLLIFVGASTFEEPLLARLPCLGGARRHFDLVRDDDGLGESLTTPVEVKECFGIENSAPGGLQKAVVAPN